jgi:hypothetical protein
VLAAKMVMFSAAVSGGVFAAAFGVCGALRAGAVPPPALPIAAVAPTFTTPDRIAAVTTPLPAMPRS